MDPFKKKQEEVTTQKFREALKESLNKKKKPVRFTWKGLGNLGISLTTNPGLIPLRQKRLEELKAGNKANEKDYIDFFEDIEASFIGGIQDLDYSIGDIITTGIAGVSGNDKLIRELDEYYERTKVRDPETLTGGIVKILTQYGAPGGAAFKVLNRVKIFQRSRKLAETGTKLQKGTQIAKRVGYMATAAGATDFIAAEPDRESLVLKQENTDNLSGRDLALARFRNRLR